MMDVSERQRLINAQARYATMLRRSNEELQQFAYVASHDLQEPLRMVTSYLQILENRYSDHLDSDAHEFIGFAVDGAARMKALINDLLAYSRVDGGEKVFEEFDAQLALNKALDNLALKIEDSGALITYDAMPTIKADRMQIIQLFQNLIGNAVKFQRAGNVPQVHIGVERKNDEWQFAVRDNGIGIGAFYLDRIFVIFQRLNKKDEYPGTGIGLAICKKVVERHGGRIWVESTVGEGTTFYFTIPV
jgi:light-regulated signal transduction histidine kinase (bacteriophytochrome)